jgi:hypothetical protein
MLIPPVRHHELDHRVLAAGPIGPQPFPHPLEDPVQGGLDADVSDRLQDLLVGRPVDKRGELLGADAGEVDFLGHAGLLWRSTLSLGGTMTPTPAAGATGRERRLRWPT